ncbi:hypothetical protein LTR35_006952 [Friedmanniomyces endolithicus]|nr:hypothetical protein LTR35_006952 [Friedmanniomyces endolithicus]KAK0296116.1 hypothetical protein LTS00_005402 [Friedmanniomyces endolithicus]
MAAAFLQLHGVDVDAEMQRIQFGQESSQNDAERPTPGNRVTTVTYASLPSTPRGSLWNVRLDPSSGKISSILPATASSFGQNDTPNPRSSTAPDQFPSPNTTHLNAHGALLTPSLCHPHIHLDKAYLLSHPRYSHLCMDRGDFAEAMELTGKAKGLFTPQDLLERGQRLIDESVEAGVTHMRAFVELDAGVGRKCLAAGLQLKRKAEGAGRCRVQLCAFAQLPLFTASNGDPEGAVIRGLMEEAAAMGEVEALGGVPYVEGDEAKMLQMVDWLIDLAIAHRKHLDFHLDYNLDPDKDPWIWHIISTLRTKTWNQRNPGRTIVLGHCTRLTLFPTPEWQRLATTIRDSGLPISIVGLPTSDLFIMHQTLDIPRMIKDFDLSACIGVNNIGNAFTPHGSCDPLTLACNGVGVYHAGTERNTEVLFECVSTRAREAIGFGRQQARGGSGEGEKDGSLRLREGDEASLLLFGDEKVAWRTRRTVAEAVYFYDHCRGRRSFLDGKEVRTT